MKKILMILLALVLGLVSAFCTTGFALDVKFSGEFYAAGMYLDKTTVKKDASDEGPSTAFYFQRLRVRTDFIISPGLMLITRFDALERSWGANRSAASTTLASDSSGSRAENENIAFDWAYVSYKSPIGVFDAGYMNSGTTGTVFGNSYAPKARMKYYPHPIGPVKLVLSMDKDKEASHTAINPSNTTDADNDKYAIEGIFNWKDGRAGFQVSYYNQRNNRPMNNYRRQYALLTPYVIAKLGPVAVQAELNYLTGKQAYEAPSTTADRDLQNITGWVDATADFGMFYAGGSIAYVSGDDPGTDKIEGGIISGGRDWNPCLIMWNYDRSNWVGNLQGYDAAAQDTAMSNAWFFQARAGVKPIPALDIMASASYAHADKKPADYLHGDYGYEIDLTAAYKITQNLSYMAGAGYLFSGKYYKGKSDANKLNDDFIVVHKLTLTF